MTPTATLVRSTSSNSNSKVRFCGPLSALAQASRAMALALTCLIGLESTSLAQAGANDPTFNVPDNGTFGDGTNGFVQAVAQQPDGKVLIGGDFSTCNSVPRNRVARMHADGSVDTGFNPAGGANDRVTAIAVQLDGKVLIGGLFTDYDGTPINRVARLNADGTRDLSFNPGAGASGAVYALTVQPDGKVLIGGSFTTFDGAARNRIARLNSDGTLDSSFAPGLGANGTTTPQVLALALQPDGKVLIGGDFTSYNGTARSRIARLNANGSLDTSFNPGTGAGMISTGDPTVQSVALQPDGKVLIGGRFTQYHGTPRTRLARLNSNGTLDTSFTPGNGPSGDSGTGLTSVYSINVQTDGQLLITGEFSHYNGSQRANIARVNSNGSLDVSFTGSTGIIRSSVLQPDGKLLIGGQFTFYNSDDRSYIARVNTDGALDASFNPGSGVNISLTAMALQPDGKALIGGSLNKFNGVASSSLLRLNIDGSLDTSFVANVVATTPGGFARVRAIALQPDGKVVVGGWFSNSGTSTSIARLNSDGSYDTSFTPGLGASLDVFAVAVQPDGKILIGGRFQFYDGVQIFRIARLNADGTLDTSFNPGSGPTGGFLSVEDLALQPDGKVLIVGAFDTFNGTPRNRIARLNADGSLDTTFNPGTGPSSPNVAFLEIDNLAVQPDGRVLVGGSFTTFDGLPRNHIARLNADGAVDTSFDPGVGADELVSTIAPQPDGAVLIGGSFTSYDGVPRSRIARLNSDGSLDTSFDPGMGASDRVVTIELQSNGKALIGGYFTSYDGAPRHRVARVFTVAPGVTVNYCTSGVSAIGCTPTMSASGVASAAATSGYFVTTSNIEGQRQTNTFYSLLGPKTPPTPFGAGFLCVKSPTQRIGSVQASGTPGLCDGSVSIDVLAWAQSHPSGQGTPYTAGMTLNFQCSIRDPLSPGTRVMSDALQVALLP